MSSGQAEQPANYRTQVVSVHEFHQLCLSRRRLVRVGAGEQTALIDIAAGIRYVCGGEQTAGHFQSAGDVETAR